MKVLHDFYSKVSLSSYFFENMKKDVCHNFDLNVDVCFVFNIFTNPTLFKRLERVGLEYYDSSFFIHSLDVKSVCILLIENMSSHSQG